MISHTHVADSLRSGGPGISRDIWPHIRCSACPAGRCPTADPHTRDSRWVPWPSTPRNYGAWWRRWDRSALAGSFWARAVSVKRGRIYSKRAERCTINVFLKSMKVLEEKEAFVVITALDMHTTAVNKCALKNRNLFLAVFRITWSYQEQHCNLEKDQHQECTIKDILLLIFLNILYLLWNDLKLLFSIRGWRYLISLRYYYRVFIFEIVFFYFQF